MLCRSRSTASPERTAEVGEQFSLPFGTTDTFSCRNPKAEALGYCRSSLRRDEHENPSGTGGGRPALSRVGSFATLVVVSGFNGFAGLRLKDFDFRKALADVFLEPIPGIVLAMA